MRISTTNSQPKAYMVFYLAKQRYYVKKEFDTLEEAKDFLTSGQTRTTGWYLVKPIKLKWIEV